MKTFAWIELHPGLAAWVQAIGSIIAIGIAIAVPWWERRAKRKADEAERLIKARSIVMLVFPELLVTRVELENAKHMLAGERPTRLPPTTVLTSLYVASNIGITVPSLLREHADDLYLLGDPAGHTLQQLLTGIMQWQDTMVPSALSVIAQDPNFKLSDLEQSFSGLVKLISDSLDQLEDELKPFDITPKPKA